MVFEHLEQLRSRSHAERVRFTWWTSLALTGVIALVWLVGVYTTRTAQNAADNAGTSAAVEPERETALHNLYPGAPRAADSERSRLQALFDQINRPALIDGANPTTSGPQQTASSTALPAPPLASSTAAAFATTSGEYGAEGAVAPPPADGASASGSAETGPVRDPFAPAP